MPPSCKRTETRSLERTAMAVRAMGITQALQSAALMDMTTKHLPTYSITKGPALGHPIISNSLTSTAETVEQ